MTTTETTPYHPGERAVQRRVGVTERADHVGRGVRPGIPPVAAAFLRECRSLAVGAADADGRIWASLLTGAPGFLDPDPADDRILTVAARPLPGDPLAEVLGGPVPVRVGTIALQPWSRRRMRANGIARPRHLDGFGGDGLVVHTDQVFANCPKYIQRRVVVAEAQSVPGEAQAEPVTRGTALGAEQRRAIAAADTFFIATADAQGRPDASHRGGNPGFVQVLGPNRLRWPDYFGNSMFMTLGNLEVNPAAGLVFPAWDGGGTIQLTGTAAVDWNSGDERAVEFTVQEVVELRAPGPRWSAPEFSPANPPVG